MEVCSSGHDEIVYETNYKHNKCPLCELIQEHSDLVKDFERLTEERDSLQSELEQARDYLSEHVPEYYL